MFTFLDYYRMKPALLPEGVEVIRGQVLYLDSAGRKTAKEKATRIDVVECSSEGREIFRTHLNKK